MQKIVSFRIALAVTTFAMIGLGSVQVVAAPDAVVMIHTSALMERVTTVAPGEQVTWTNASGTPVVHVVFDEVVGAPEATGLFTGSFTRSFSRPGVYPYTVHVGTKARPLRGKIVVK